MVHYIWGGDGNDVLRGEGGDDVVSGGQGHDNIGGGLGDDLLDGGDGRNRINGHEGDDDIFGGVHRDVLNGQDGDDEIHGGSGPGKITGGSGDDLIYDGNGDDCLEGDGGDDIIYGGSGNDSIIGGNGDDTVYGGDGDDKIGALRFAEPETPFDFNPARQTAQSGDATEHYKDWVTSLIYAGAGNDQVAVYNAGTAFGEDGNDYFHTSANSFVHISGGAGEDTVRIGATNFWDVEWFRSPTGEIAAKIWVNHSSGAR